jgi:hypothetical protein
MLVNLGASNLRQLRSIPMKLAPSRLKFLTTLAATALATAPVAFAEPESEQPPPFHIAGKTSAALQKYSGLTWISEKGIGFVGTLASRCWLGGRPTFKVKAYSFTDCLSGKFRSVSINLRDCSYKKVPLAHLSLQTSTPLHVRLFGSSKGAAGVAAPVMVSVSGNLDENDVSRALQSQPVASQLGFLRLTLPGLGDQHLQVVEPKVKLENGKVKINTWLITAGAPKDTGISLDVVASPRLEGERFIMLKDTQVSSPDIIEPEQFSVFSQNLLNPLLDFGRFDRKTHAFRLTRLNCTEQKLQFAGKLLLVPKTVPPNPATPPPASK